MGGFKTFADGDVLTAADVNNYLMGQVVIVCTSGTRPTTPTDGMVIYETDTDQLMVRESSTWRRVLLDSDPAGGPWASYTPALDNSGSTSYVAGSDNSVVFTAPKSGKVYVAITATVGTNAVTATAGVLLSYEIRTGSTIGSGTVVVAADDGRAALYQPNNPTTGFKYTTVPLRLPATGLTAGSTYHARTMFRSDTGGGTAARTRSWLVVEPAM